MKEVRERGGRGTGGKGSALNGGGNTTRAGDKLDKQTKHVNDTQKETERARERE